MRRDKYQRNVLEFYVEIKTAATYREGFTETYREELGVHLTEFDGDFLEGPPGPGPRGGPGSASLFAHPPRQAITRPGPTPVEDGESSDHDDGLDSQTEHPAVKTAKKPKRTTGPVKVEVEADEEEFVFHVLFLQPFSNNLRQHVVYTLCRTFQVWMPPCPRS